MARTIARSEAGTNRLWTRRIRGYAACPDPSPAGREVSEDVEPDRAVPAVPADLEPLLPGEQVARHGAVGEPERLDRPAVLPDSNHPAGR